MAIRFAFSSWRCRKTARIRVLLTSRITMGRRIFLPADAVTAVMLPGNDISL